MTKLSFRIYRVDIEHPDLRSRELHDVPQFIVDKYNESKQEVIFNPVDATAYQADIGGGKTIHFYKKENARALPHLWRSFFEDTAVNFGTIHTELHHMVGFIVDGVNGQLFAITTGQAYVTFEKYVDYDFPLTVARKVTHPEIKGGEIKGLTGYLQASSLQFRRPRRVSSAESIGTIWTQFSGNLREATLSDPIFIELFGRKSKASIEVKGSVGIKQKLDDLGKLSDYINWLWRIYDQDQVPRDSENDFAFLDAVRKISARRFPDKVEMLRAKAVERISSNEIEDFAICHRDHSRYLNADSYQVKYNGETFEFDSPPELAEIFSRLTYTPTEIPQLLEKMRIEAIYDIEPHQNVEGTLEDLLCGEVNVEPGKTCFLLNNEWFELKESFIRMVRDAFEQIVNDSTSEANLTMPRWTQTSEGAYNESFQGRDDYVVGDKVLIENTELFDLLHWDNENLYILHVKSGFGVKTRDVTSQIFNAAQIIENDVSTGKILLGRYYERLSSPPISREDFLRLFNKKRIYVLGYGRAASLRSASVIRSNIAKLELVQLRNDMRRFEGHADFKLQWIQKP